MVIGPREHNAWDTDADMMDDVPCIHDWDGNYPGEDDDNDTPYMYEDDNDEVTTLDDIPF
tara:strand:- start:335 stop:514 length:180 start_codon:yes stop_codon:yes gene_type:complete